MTAHDLGLIAIGMAIPLTIRALIAMIEYKEQVNKAVDGNDMVVHQPEYATNYLEREARRVERPLYERSVPGFVVREVDIDVAHAIVNAEPGSITYLRGARAE